MEVHEHDRYTGDAESQNRKQLPGIFPWPHPHQLHHYAGGQRECQQGENDPADDGDHTVDADQERSSCRLSVHVGALRASTVMAV